MSPSEFDLRSALRDGEGEVPDVAQVLAGARRHSQRRVRVLTAAAAVVVVAGVAAGVAALARAGGGTGAGPGNDVAAANGARPSFSRPSGADAAGGRAAPAASPGSSVGADCPASFPRTLLPGGGSPGQFGAGGPLFAQRVSTVVICSYGTAGSGRRVLSGSSATALVSSLEHAATRPRAIPCPDIVAADRTSLVIIGVTSSGTKLRAVTTTLSFPACNVQVTNGTAIRYDWSPSAALRRALTPSRPAASGSAVTQPVHVLPDLSPLDTTPPAASPPGSPVRTAHGSPVH